MPKHALKSCWLHLIWSTKNRAPYFKNEHKATQVLGLMKTICTENNIYFKTGSINPEHVHLLIDLPVDLSIQRMMQLMKGISSYKINQLPLFNRKFSWARGYASLSVSQNKILVVQNYIDNQKEHHRKKTFLEEWRELIQKYE